MLIPLDNKEWYCPHFTDAKVESCGSEMICSGFYRKSRSGLYFYHYPSTPPQNKIFHSVFFLAIIYRLILKVLNVESRRMN